MNPCTLIFCFFIGSAIEGIGVHGLRKNHEQIAVHLIDQRRWEKEVSEFTTGLQYRDDDNRPVEISTGPSAPTDVGLYTSEMKFLLYTRRNRYKADILSSTDPDSLKNSHFDKRERTIFVTHGWINSGKSESCVSIRDAYLSVHNPNVIVVDWGTVAWNPLYPQVAAKVPTVGAGVARFMEYLSHNGYLKVDDTILVGHSLGAHVVGTAGYSVRGTPMAVFGLDPALPLFKFAAPGYRISSQDATHVQIIHTNAGELGTNARWGHVSFLMDGGNQQPGCQDAACSHSRAHQYFAESINTTLGFYGVQCRATLESTVELCTSKNNPRMGGYLPDQSAENGDIWMVPVNDSSPFSLGPAPSMGK